MSDSAGELMWAARTRASARQALAETFEQLRTPLWRYLRSLGMNHAQAEEIVQETFCRLCAQTEAVERGWAFRVAHNLARDEQRTRARLAGPERLTLVPDSRKEPESAVLGAERAAQLRSALARLPQRQQECLHLRAEGLKYREISEVLGAPLSTVAEWVQTALRTLREECDGAPSR